MTVSRLPASYGAAEFPSRFPHFRQINMLTQIGSCRLESVGMN